MGTPVLDQHFPAIGFIGAGNMAGAIIRGIIQAGMITPSRVTIFDPDEAKMKALQDECGCKATQSLEALVEQGGAEQTLMLCVKPQIMGSVLESLQPLVFDNQRVVSIAAGILARTISEGLGGKPRVVRVMPNTPSLVGVGASGVAAGPGADQADVDAVLALCNAIGISIDVEEDLINSVTALSGSGPAYFFRIMEAMIEEGMRQGFTEEQAHQLTIQTCLGAATLAKESDVGPDELRRRVTSPGGTTEAALKTFEIEGLGDIIGSGMRAAAARSRELSGE